MLQQQTGLTLPEILVVMVMLVMLAAVLTPTMITYFHQANIKGAAEALYNDVNLARTTATKSTDTVTITFTTGASWCYGLSSATTACTCSASASSTNCNLGITTSSGFKDTSLAVAATTMTFSIARGTTSSNAATFSADTQSATVNINTLGTSSICSTNVTVGGYPAC